MKSVCVFCGSSPGHDPIHAEAARALGAALGRTGVDLVYGGGKVGLMGILADAALAAGARVVGVIPHSMVEREWAKRECTELHVVENMHQRKMLMAERADAFLALPGGIGTFEELFEIWTWRQLGYHDKPVGLLNAAGYYDTMLEFLAHRVREAFMGEWQMDLIRTGTEPADLLKALQAEVPHHPQGDRLAENI